MGCINDSIRGILIAAGMPDFVIHHFDEIGEGIEVDVAEVYNNDRDWVIIMTTEDGLQAPLRVPRDCPPELLTDELRAALIAGIKDEFDAERRRRAARKEFNQPQIENGQAPTRH
jgi:hypothetical protein